MFTSYLAAVLNVSTIICLNQSPDQEYYNFTIHVPNYPSNEPLRWTHYCTNRLIIQDFNKKTNYKFKLGPNDNMDKSYAQYLATYMAFGRRQIPKNYTRREYSSIDEKTLDDIYYPETVDYSNLLSPPIDQDHCGSCYAHATYVSMSAVYALRNNLTNFLFSVQYFLDCGLRQGLPNCLGGVAADAVDFAKEWGLVTEANYPYQGIINWCRHDDMKKEGKIIRSFVDEAIIYEGRDPVIIKKMLAKYGPLLAPLVATDYIFQFYKSGIINKPCEFGTENHYVNIVGYNTTEDGIEYWIVRNSMGTSWGENGYFRIIMGENLCKIEDHVIAVPSSAVVISPISAFFIIIYSYFLSD